MKLRPYQDKQIADMRESFGRGSRGVVLQLPTGGGKTVICSAIAALLAAKGNVPLVFVVHRKELMDQTVKTFSATGIQSGCISAGRRTPDCDVLVAMVQTLRGRVGKMPRTPKAIIIDEAHLAMARSYLDVCDAFPEAIRILVTATPQRLDGKGLGALADDIVYGPTIPSLVEQGYLVGCRIFSIEFDTSGLKTARGDYTSASIEESLGKAIFGDALKIWKEKANGKKTIVFCHSVQAAKETAAAFCEGGVVAAALDGKDTKERRRAVIDVFRKGEINVMCNVGLFVEGLDVPDIECVILMAPTKSLVRYLQSIGRGLRPAPGKKELIVLDMVANYVEHGHPFEAREWSLSDRPKAKKGPGEVEQTGKICTTCYFANVPGAKVCADCGEELPVVERKMETRADVGLIEIKFNADGTVDLGDMGPDQVKKFRKNKELPLRMWRAMKREEEAAAGDYRSLVAHARKWGYKAMWALHRKLPRSEDDVREFAKWAGYREGWVRHYMANNEHEIYREQK